MTATTSSTRCANCDHLNPQGFEYCGHCGWRNGGYDEATRYLCAAAHLDSKLANELVRKVLEEPHRAVARSPGIDLVTVLKHVLASRSRHLARDVTLLFGLIALIAMVLISQWSWAVLMLLVGWITVFVEAYVARWGLVGRTLRRGSFQAADAPEPKHDIQRRQLQHVAQYMAGNVTTYRGYKPFMGHGFVIDSWSMALDVSKPATARPAGTVDVVQLHDRIKEELRNLDFPGLSVYDRLFVNGEDVRPDSGLIDTPLARPVDWADNALLRELLATPGNRARPYLTVEIIGWGGELVCSIFVRLLVNSANLFVEASYALLPPLMMKYHEVDVLRPYPSPGQFTRLIFRTLVWLPGRYFRCIPAVLGRVFAGPRRYLKERRQIRDIRRFQIFDHGALISIREHASDLRSRIPAGLNPVYAALARLFLKNDGYVLGYHHYFQSLDKEMYIKAVEKRLFLVINRYLNEQNIDAGELARRAEMIINNSVHIGPRTDVAIKADGPVSGVAIASPSATVTGNAS